MAFWRLIIFSLLLLLFLLYYFIFLFSVCHLRLVPCDFTYIGFIVDKCLSSPRQTFFTYLGSNCKPNIECHSIFAWKSWTIHTIIELARFSRTALTMSEIQFPATQVTTKCNLYSIHFFFVLSPLLAFLTSYMTKMRMRNDFKCKKRKITY